MICAPAWTVTAAFGWDGSLFTSRLGLLPATIFQDRVATGERKCHAFTVPAGAKVHAHSRLVGADSHPKGTQVTQEIQVNVVGQERPALIYEMVVLYHPAMKRS